MQPPPQPSLRAGVPVAMDQVIATGMAKNPDQRYASTVELARAARDATTVPLVRPGPAVPAQPPRWPGHLIADPIDSHVTPLAAAGAAPVLPPRPGPPRRHPPPLQPTPTPKGPGWRRPRVVIPAVVAVVLLIGGGIFAAVKLSHHQNPAATAPTATAPPNTGSFTGTFTADFGPALEFAGKPIEGEPPYKATWLLRSVCGASGCVATAAPGRFPPKGEVVFDDVGGRWLAVAASTAKCGNLDAEAFDVVSLQPRPDGTMSGEWISTDSQGCYGKRTVTFTRTADTDVDTLTDPATQPPRVVSPAQALHGRYHDTLTYTTTGSKEEFDVGVRTDCLRSGDRCMSFFYSADGVTPLVFANGKSTDNSEGDTPCSAGGTNHVKHTAEYPLPQPPQDPITLLTGHGHVDSTGSACPSSDFDNKFVRTGD
jgi:hypothetical protein